MPSPIYKLHTLGNSQEIIKGSSYEQLFRSKDPEIYPDTRHAAFKVDNNLHVAGGNISEEIAEEEIENAMNASKSSAKCKDGYSSHDLKALGYDLVKILSKVYNDAMKNGKLDEKFLNNHFSFIHKTGDITDPKNYRSISIQNPILKILMKILNNKIMNMLELDNKLPNFQMGFTKKKKYSISSMDIEIHLLEQAKREEKNLSLFC